MIGSIDNENTRLAGKIASLAEKEGGRAFYVGGCVRDHLRGVPLKDIDIEVHGITPQKLEAILDTLGQRLNIGAFFGIYGIKGYEVDIALPRREKKEGEGHRDFSVEVDPFAGTLSAARRRDFTINALMMDILTGEIIDHFGGIEDLRSGILRAVSADTFAEDPLRVLRGAQFAARFGFRLDDETVEICRGMDLAALSRERVEGELKKAMLASHRPSVFFEILRQCGALFPWFTEAEALIGVRQDPRFHAEGDVWTHTMMVIDEAAKYSGSVSNPFGFMLAALTHDFGKAVSTTETGGAVHAYGHEEESVRIAAAFMDRLTGEKELRNYVLNLTRYHMKPNTVAADRSAVKTTNRMFDESVDPEALIYLATADSLGKISEGTYVSYEEFLFERLEIYREYMARPYVMGRDLIDAGVQPGEDFSELLSYAHKLRLAGIPKGEALKQVISRARKEREKGKNGLSH